MLQKIKIQNFKLHKDTSLEIKPITLFIGQNNSGKSSIFQALQLVKQNLTLHQLVPPKPTNFTSYYLYPNSMIDIGNFEDLLRKNERFIGILMEGNMYYNKRDF